MDLRPMLHVQTSVSIIIDRIFGVRFTWWAQGILSSPPRSDRRSYLVRTAVWFHGDKAAEA
jgi:hypothetical protein